jgi:ribosome-binding factor A
MANARARARIEARILERVAYCVEFELADPRSAFITITRVEVSPDLSSARIFYSVLGTEGEKSRVAHMLGGASGFVRQKLGRVLETRKTPRLTWIFDDSIERQAEMEEKIAAALKHDREINPTAHAGTEVAPPEDEGAEVAGEYEDFLDAQEEEEGG